MRSQFFQGLFWGGVTGAVLALVLHPKLHERGTLSKFRDADDVISVARGMMKDVRRFRRRLSSF